MKRAARKGRRLLESPARRCAQGLTAGRGGGAGGGWVRARCSANIALVKYWGKRDEGLRLPVTSSLSVSTGDWGSTVALAVARGGEGDEIEHNGVKVAAGAPFAERLSGFLDFFRPEADFYFRVRTWNTVPTAAGFASSASGFAAVTRALDKLFGWHFGVRTLSVLARLGSGSAARSLEAGFVEWRAGKRADGLDSYGVRLGARYPGLRLGAVVVSGEEKALGSRAAMRRSRETSPLYGAWPGVVARDLRKMRRAIRERDIALLGGTAEANALAMHAVMLASRPAIFYPLPGTLAAMRRVWALRAEGTPVWFTMDAGPNLKLLFEAGEEGRICSAFPGVHIIAPFEVGDLPRVGKKA